MAYKIFRLATLQCTEWQHGSEKKGMVDALSLLNINDARHLEHLAWVVYDGTLLVGRRPELPRDCQWCTILAGTYKLIYRGHDDVAHCPPYTLASWDCQERTEVWCFIERENWTLHGVPTREHPGPGEDPGAAPGATPGCWLLGIGVDTPAACHPTCHQGATAGNPYP